MQEEQDKRLELSEWSLLSPRPYELRYPHAVTALSASLTRLLFGIGYIMLVISYPVTSDECVMWSPRVSDDNQFDIF